MIDCYFSVVIPALNEEKYLPKLLTSLTIQSFKDFEVVLVDGDSKDKTRDVFKKFTKNLPKSQLVVTDKRNVAYQRNLGGQKANGKYLIFLDADVNVGSTFLEELHLASIKKKFDLATTWITYDSNKPIDQIMLLLGNLAQEMGKIINKPFSGGYNTIIKREVFLKLNGFREDLLISEDHDFAIRALKKKIEVIILPEPKVIYSLRRFRSEGTLSVLRKYAKATLYTLLKGPITHQLFEYQMGGHVHRERRRKINLKKINTYIKAIGRLEDKLNRLMGD